MSTPLLATVSPSTVIIALLIGILVFGNRLPEMGRVLARTIREFRKTMSGIEDEVVDSVGNTNHPALPQRISLPSPSITERNGLAPEPPGV